MWDTTNVKLAELYSTKPGDPLVDPACTVKSASLDAFAGQTVRIAFVTENNQLWLNVFIDDVSVVVGAEDCNANGILDECELTSETDCNANGVLDECELTSDTDCNGNGVLDECEITTETDCNSNGVPDECETDCNGNGVPDDCDITSGTSPDCNGNGIPDECDLETTLALTNEAADECGDAGYVQPGVVYNGDTDQRDERRLRVLRRQRVLAGCVVQVPSGAERPAQRQPVRQLV